MGKNINSVVSYGDFGQINSFTNTIGNKTDTISYTYDDFYRIKSRNLNGMEDSTEYTYLKGQNGQDTTLVESFNNSKETYSYEYDQYGNIISVYKEGILTEEYEYDDLNQLVWAKIGEDEYAYTYALDNSSNLEFVYKNGTIIKTYGYMPAGETWVDKLNSFTGTAINYDEIGNPLNWRNGMTFSWEYGRRLKTVTADGNNISYTYDADGLRTSKTVNGVKTEYYWLDGVLQGQKTGSEYIIFLYDENGTAYGMLINQNGVENYYYYLFNLQGDIVGIMDSNGNTVAEYTYDAWGQLLTTTGTLKDTIGQKNPLRYRGYYYDSETEFYYLKSRYYDPYVQRFINADGYASTGQGLTGYNMYAYCNNNPVNMTDETGLSPKRIWRFVKKLVDISAQIACISADPLGRTLSVVAHYNRNQFNNDDYSEEELKNNYQPEPPSSDKFHQNNQVNNMRNRKYVIGEWFSSEVVYYSNGTINNSPEDIGTFNVYSGDNRFLNVVVHGCFDVMPYIFWGNSLDDSTTIIDRIILVFGE
ncbi:MAG: RHS repeat-associated core domain-containing protein [Ruminococcaceae bacterium]|nr:RHS repeat-associated core domain-containing protein [Oscillospiraceae bacterium]